MSETLAATRDIQRNQLPTDATAVLIGLSEGHTSAQIARHLNVEVAFVKTAKDSIRSAFGTSSLAATVGIAIRQDIIPIEVRPDDQITGALRPTDLGLLRYYAKGGSNRRLSELTMTDMHTIETYHDGLLERIKAWSRPHGIRRTYELGILAVGAQQEIN